MKAEKTKKTFWGKVFGAFKGYQHQHQHGQQQLVDGRTFVSLDRIGFGGITNIQDFRLFLEDGYGSNPDVYAAINRISIPISALIREVKDDEGEVIEDGELDRLLNGLDYEKVSINLLATGNAYIWKQPKAGALTEFEQSVSAIIGNDAPSQIECLKVLYTPDVTINTTDGTAYGEVSGYTYKSATPIPPEQIIHIKLPNTVEDSHYGLSPLYAAYMAWRASSNILASEAFIHDNMGTQGFLSQKGGDFASDLKEIDALNETFKSRNSGSKLSGQIHVTSNSYDYFNIGFTPKDLMSVEAHASKRAVIASVYSISPTLLGDMASSTYDNYTTAQEALYTDAVLPLDDRITRALTDQLIKSEFVLDAKLTTDTSGIEALNKTDKVLSEKVAIDLASGVITASEGRSILYPELPEIDIVEQVQPDLVDTESQELQPEQEGQEVAGVSLNGAQVTAVVGVIDALNSGAMSTEQGRVVLEGLGVFNAQQIDQILNNTIEPPENGDNRTEANTSPNQETQSEES